MHFFGGCTILQILNSKKNYKNKLNRSNDLKFLKNVKQ